MRHLALALFCASLFAFIAISGAVTVQITVFCNGGIVYDNAVTAAGSNPTAWDAIKQVMPECSPIPQIPAAQINGFL